MKKLVLTGLVALILGGTACTWQLLPDGARCGNAEQCSSDSCVDGVCCDWEYCGGCYSCALRGKEGVCSPVPAGQGSCDLGGGCQPTCDGAGGCDGASCGWERPDAASCSGDWECASGFCEQGVCCATACTGPCRSCAGYQPGVCVDVPAGEDPHGDCTLGECQAKCDGAGACDLAGSGICGGDQCVDGAADLFGRPTGSSATFPFCAGAGQSCPGTSGPSQSCGLFACDGTTCGTRCDGQSDCVAGSACTSGSCVPCVADSDCSPSEPYCKWGPGFACARVADTTCGYATSTTVCSRAGFGSLCSIASDACQCVPGDGACNSRGPRCDGNPGSCTCGAAPGSLCPVGQRCSDATTSGTCKIAPLFPCTADPADCVSGYCEGSGVCGPLQAGSPCASWWDCASWHCGATWTCE